MGNLCLKINVSESKPGLKRNPSIEKIKKDYYQELNQGLHKSINFSPVNKYIYNLQTETWEKIT